LRAPDFGHHDSVPFERFAAAWPAHPDSVPAARHAVLGYLERAETADPPLNDIGLVVSEAVTNAVNHAYLDRDPGDVRVAVDVVDDELEVIIEDDGRGMLPRPDSPGLGLGLPLIASVSDRFDTRTAPGGGTRICAWFRRRPSRTAATAGA
jgi:serine/threonine-protein kinase RsbW/stage II sporulation protein AB (anti-sigma F factor)